MWGRVRVCARSRQCSFLHSRLSLMLTWDAPAAQWLTRRKKVQVPQAKCTPPPLTNPPQPSYPSGASKSTPLHHNHTSTNLTTHSLSRCHTHRWMYPRNLQLWQKTNKYKADHHLSMVGIYTTVTPKWLHRQKLRTTPVWWSLPWILMDGWPKSLTT